MTKRIITKKDRLYVCCDLYEAGMTEDGENFIAESYYIVIERCDGHRLAHNKVYLGCELCVIDDGDNGQYNGLPYFADVRKEVKKTIDLLLSRIVSKGAIDTDYWSEMRPSYGSEYYCVCHNL